MIKVNKDVDFNPELSDLNSDFLFFESAFRNTWVKNLSEVA